jgi:hypothetical protein
MKTLGMISKLTYIYNLESFKQKLLTKVAI